MAACYRALGKYYESRGDYNQGIGYRLRAAELFRGFSNYYLLDVLGRQLSQQLALRVGTTTLPLASNLAAGGIFTLETTGLLNIGNALAVSAVNQLGQMVYC